MRPEMKYGAMNFPIKPFLKEIEEIGELGFDYVELTMDPLRPSHKKFCHKREPSSKFSVDTVWASWDISLLLSGPRTSMKA